MTEITVTLVFDAPSLAEGERLRKALARSARRVARESRLVSSSYATDAVAAEDVDE